MLNFRGFLFAALLTSTAYCQTPAAPPVVAPGERPRVFITDSQSWEMRGSAGGSGGTFAAHSSGGARPQTAEIIKTFGEKCPSVMVNNIQSKANYVVVLDHEGGKGFLAHRNKVAVFDAASGDSVISKSTLSLGGSVEEACRGIAAHWAGHQSAGADDSAARPQSAAPPAPSESAAPANSAAPAVSAMAAAAPSAAHLNVMSTPESADIEIDGSFVGNTPSSLQVTPGEHNVVVKKSGYKPWERKLKVVGGDVNLRAEMEKN